MLSMKTLLNKQFELVSHKDEKGVDVKFQTKDFAKVCVNNPKEGGFTPDEMKKRIRLIDLFEEEKKEYQVEDADLQELKTCVSSMKWAIAHKDIVSFSEDIENL